MPYDISPDDIERARRTLVLAPLKAERKRMCAFTSIHVNAMVRNAWRDDHEAAYEQQRGSELMLDEAARLSREIDAMEAGI